MTTAGLAIVFAIAVVPLVPTEPALIGMGVLAVTGRVSLSATIAIAAIGCSISDHLLYFVGRTVGASMTGRTARRPRCAATLAWLTRNVTRWGPQALVAGRWIPAGGTAGALAAGMARWPLRQFMPASIIGCALWSAYAVLLGYTGGVMTSRPAAGLLVSLAIAAVVAWSARTALCRPEREAAAQHTRPGRGGLDRHEQPTSPRPATGQGSTR